MAKISRQRGKAFELKCRKVIAVLTDHPDWERTQRGVTQKELDLIPVDWPGDRPQPPLVECKTATRITKAVFRGWVADVVETAEDRQWYLLWGQPQGPVYALRRTYWADYDGILGPIEMVFV